jgi:iron complex transport system ATP-binding protein
LEVECLVVAFYTAAVPALDSVTLSVAGGEILSLIGPNGAGKSTLLRAAAALLVPQSGVVRVAGRDARALSRREVARLVALVPQGDELGNWFRVVEVVEMGRSPHQGRWMRTTPEDARAVESALTRCDLVALAGRRVDTLSGGERRRVAIARALAQQPRVLLLDEPSAFLDARHRRELEALLADVVATERIACIVTMHDLDAAARMSSRVALLNAGKLLAIGSPSEVMTPELLRRAFGVDIDATATRRAGFHCA